MDVLSTPCSACKPALMMTATDQGPDLWTAVLSTHVPLINLKYSAILPIHLGGIFFPYGKANINENTFIMQHFRPTGH